MSCRPRRRAVLIPTAKRRPRSGGEAGAAAPESTLTSVIAARKRLCSPFPFIPSFLLTWIMTYLLVVWTLTFRVYPFFLCVLKYECAVHCIKV